MVGFDPALDQELYSTETEINNFKFKVSVMSYNDGQPKMQISRTRKLQSGETSFAKLGRLTLEEIEVVFPLIQKVKEHMEQNKPEEAPAEDSAETEE
ncbi:MAG: hypothetical protein V1729_05200 [Candidatus Woesearchaeota archaeon]